MLEEDLGKEEEESLHPTTESQYSGEACRKLRAGSRGAAIYPNIQKGGFHKTQQHGSSLQKNLLGLNIFLKYSEA